MYCSLYPGPKHLSQWLDSRCYFYAAMCHHALISCDEARREYGFVECAAHFVHRRRVVRLFVGRQLLGLYDEPV